MKKFILPILILLGVTVWGLWPEPHIEPHIKVGDLTIAQKLANETSRYAHINSSGIVDGVIVISDETIDSAGGWELNGIFRPRNEWVKTSKDSLIRKNYAGIGFTYSTTSDAFIAPKPSIDSTLDTTTGKWITPVDSSIFIKRK